jgi:hypothetical protein
LLGSQLSNCFRSLATALAATHYRRDTGRAIQPQKMIHNNQQPTTKINDERARECARGDAPREILLQKMCNTASDMQTASWISSCSKNLDKPAILRGAVPTRPPEEERARSRL